MATFRSGRKMKNGETRVICDLKPGESFHVFRDDAHYRLGEPIGDVLPGHIIAESVQVMWCPVAQKWVD